MEKRTRVTMADVARAANVTPQTVSRAFRNAPDISEETRERVLSVAAELNYVMNGTASSLRGGNSRQIVVLYDNLLNLYFSIMIDYLQSSLRELGYSVLVLSVENARFDRSVYEYAVSHNAAGILSFLEPDEEIGRLVESFSVPVLVLGRRTGIANIDYLRTDDEQGGALAAKRLMERGAQRFAYLSVELSVSCAYDRLQGFERELLRSGFHAPAVINAYAAPLEETLTALFANPETAPDGVFCFNDMLALDVLYYARKNCFPPVHIVGYDCIQQEFHTPTRIPSVGTDKHAFAARAAELIVSRVEGGSEGRRAETAGVFLYADD